MKVPAPLNKIPGFRSGHIGKMISASIGYFFIILIIAVMLTPTDRTSSSAALSVGYGEEGILYTEGSSKVAVCWTKDDFDAMIDAAVVKDKIGWQQLFLNGKCYLAPANTKVLVLDSSWGAKKFRFLEGDFYAETAWTAMEYIVPLE